MNTLARRGRVGSGIVLAALAAAVAPSRLRSQELPLKRPKLTPISIACPAIPVPPPTAQQVVEEANRLATLGQESSIEGDHRAARDQFKQAATLDPRDASLAYRLAREYEDLQQRDAAVHEYCRYLSLVPNATDAAQIGDRVAKLLPGGVLAHGNAVVAQFKLGVASYDTRSYGTAAQEFDSVSTSTPTLSAAAYDGGLAHDQDGDAAPAIHDYSRYLQLEPNASDAAIVQARIQQMRHGIPSATTAFFLGLLPGVGQFYTKQPVLGVVVIAGAAGGVFLALQTRTLTRDTTFTGPFGGTYPGTYTQTQHPNLVLGAAVAGGVTLLGAIEAAVVAHGRGAGLDDGGDADRGAPGTALLPHVGPVTLELPTVIAASDGLRLAVPLHVTF
jgi:TM2 domain-containing membrane protein YozV